MVSFESLEERRVLTNYVLPVFTSARPTADVIGVISNTNPSNTYQIDLAMASVMQGNLSGLSANLDFVLKNSAGAEVAASRKTGVTLDSFATTAQLPGGRYTLEVIRVGSAQSRYRLTLSIVGSDDLLTGAVSLGTVGTPTPSQYVAGSLTGGSDIQDFFRFNTNGTQPIRLSLSGMTSDLNVQVLDRNGVLITQGQGVGTALEDVTFTPTSGLYYLRILTNVTGSSKYHLDISNNLPSDDLFVAPASVGTLTSDQPIQFREDHLGSYDFQDFDPQDYYRFALPATSPVRINLRGYNVALASIEVLDQFGRTIVFQSSFENQIYNLFHPALGPGRYSIRLFQERHGVMYRDYVLYVLVVGTDISRDDFPTNAINLGTFDQTSLRSVRVVDSVGDGADKLDHYRFTLTAPTPFSLSATAQRSDVYIRFFRFGADEGSLGGTTIYLRMSTMSSPFTLQAGNYLIYIKPAYRDAPSSYILTISGDPETNDIQGMGTNVGTLIPQQRPTAVATDSVGGIDIQDFYRFNILAPSHAFVTLGNMTANLGIELLDRWGRSRGTRSSNAGTGLETIALNNLDADTYYIRIYPEPGEPISSYDLMISLSGGDDLISGAVPLGVLDLSTRTTASFAGTVGGATDIQDFYRVSLAQNSTLHVRVTGPTSVFQIQILTADGELITQLRTSATTNELSVALVADDYVLRITCPYALRQYQLVARVS